MDNTLTRIAAALWIVANAAALWALLWLLGRRPWLLQPRLRAVLSCVAMVFGILSAFLLALSVGANWWSGNVGSITGRFNFVATGGFCLAALGCGIGFWGIGRARIFSILHSLLTMVAWLGYSASLRSGL